jgi:hypothetical protein
MEVKILISRWKTKTVGFEFDMYAWFLLCKANGIELWQIGDIPQDKMFADLIYSAYVSFNTDKRMNMSGFKLLRKLVSSEKLAGYVDKMNHKDTELIGNEILKSKVFGKSVTDWAVEGNKAKKKT